MGLDKKLMRMELDRSRSHTVGCIPENTEGLEFLFDDGTMDLQEDFVYSRMLAARQLAVGMSESQKKRHYTKAKDKILEDYKRKYHEEYAGNYLDKLSRLDFNTRS